ncbi:MAG TPA: hypothetical protein VHD33_05725, partial [Legionellaceae bacterium]|nr:hypothetical protein [Legionellaceae bacterium]
MINIDNLLNPQALKLSKIHINDLLYQFDRLHPDGYWRRYCVMAVFAAVKVDYVPVGKFPDFKYIQAWANMLNFLADNNIWDYGSFVGFNAIELGSLNLNPTIKSWALCSYIFPSRDFVDLDPVSDLNKRL